MKRFQKRNRNGLMKERWIMVGGSVFVLAALTLTGIYVRNISNQQDEYIVDFTTLEDLHDSTEILEAAQNDFSNTAAENNFLDNVIDSQVPSDDLDYDPFYQETSSFEPASSLPDAIKEQIGANGDPISERVTSSDLEVGELVMAAVDDDAAKPEVTEEKVEETVSTERAASEEKPRAETEAVPPATTPPAAAPPAATPAISTSMQTALTFKDGDNLVWPVVGNVLINYSMDKTVYFPTLKQYRYNPAIIIQATEGDIITAAAAGKVTAVFSDARIGNAITMELGNGFEVTYGQLKNVLVSEGSFVAAGDVMAEVAAPTKYYSIEGTNVYFKLTKDGKAVNPLAKLN
jgi:murein DD-endopeptidase MepM/ murein hydrolase activator NlpD